MTDISIIDILLYACAATIVYRFIIDRISSDDDQYPIEVVFPVKLEYTDTQWYGWDNDGEFLGQAPTKTLLMDAISKDVDLPLDKFQILSESVLVNKLK